MMNKINVSAVSYLNTKPFLYGLEKSAILWEINLSKNIPAKVAEDLITGHATIGLVPVAAIPSIANANIITDYGIGSNGEVSSVCIYSQVPIESVETLYLDYQSRTSLELTRILLRDYWKLNPELKAAQPGYEFLINDNVAGLIIGDRSLTMKSQFRYCYDLGKAWKEHTGLPFIFACWVSNKVLPANFIASFESALQSGIENIATIVKTNQPAFEGIDIDDYLNNKVKFRLTEEMKSGMELFFESIKQPVTI
jgi:chorismate dehydratase